MPLQKGQKTTFKNKKTLEKMLQMRQEGWSYPTLGSFFGVDHSTIYYECVKHHVRKEKSKNFSFFTIIRTIIIPKPRNYLDYLE